MYLAVDQNQPDSYCCVPTTASMVVDHGTAGVKRPPVEKLRRATGIPHPKGISYVAIADAVERVSNVELQPRYGLSRYEVSVLVASGRSIGISIDCSVTRYTSRRTGTFTGGHTVFACDTSVWRGGWPCDCDKRSSTRHSEFTVQDPGTYSQGYLQWSADLLFKAAEARTGGNGINVLVGLDTEWVWRKCVRTGYLRQRPTTKSPRTRTLVVGQAYRVAQIVNGERWRRSDGSYSDAWYQTPHDDFIRGDRLYHVNVSAP